jgi:hypothetical protein
MPRHARFVLALPISCSCLLAPACVAQESPASGPAKPAPEASPAKRDDAKLNERIDAISNKAIAWLRAQQDESGGWSVNKDGPTYPAIAALVLNGMLMQPGIDDKDPSVAKGVAWVLKRAQPDGGIYDTVLPSYNTSICVSMLARVNTPEAKQAVTRGIAFLKGLQFGDGAMVDGPAAKETGRVEKSHPFYGGMGYGRSGRPDLSNLAFFVQAMHDARVPADDPAFQRALVFLQRTQMLGSVNDMEYAKGSTQGGFIYSTSPDKDHPGEGQSNAGEIEESMDGPPGSVVTITLSRGPDGRPRSLPKEMVVDRVKNALARSQTKEIAESGQFRVLASPSSDLKIGTAFEVRSPVVSAREELRRTIEEAFGDMGAGNVRVSVAPAAAWKGTSHWRAYGSMTYAGFKSYLYAKLSRDDERVKGAMRWISSHYALDENPGIGRDGMYYYFVTFARALHAWGEPTIDVTIESGTSPRDWRKDLVDRLESLQKPEGSFKMLDERWMEGNEVLITAYALLALQNAREETKAP